MLRGPAFHQGLRRAAALLTVVWWVAGTLAVLLLSFQWTLHRQRIERKVFGTTDLFYLAEAVLTREIARLKVRPWRERWYFDPAVPPPGGLHGADISGSFHAADYVGHVQDVADFWTDPSGASGRVLQDHTDIFLRITHPRGKPDATTSHFVHRVVFRLPSPERPTVFSTRRLERVNDFDPISAGDRAAVLARVNRDERLRERNRPTTAVLVREIGRLAGRGAAVREIARAIGDRGSSGAWAILAGPATAGVASTERTREQARPQAAAQEREIRDLHRREPTFSFHAIKEALDYPHLRAQILLETRLTSSLRAGQRMLSDPASAPATGTTTHGALFYSAESFRVSNVLARRQCAANQRLSVPMTLHALGRAEWALGRSYPRCSPPCGSGSPCPRHRYLGQAAARFQEIVDRYRWVPDPTSADFSPTRFEAPHALFTLASVRLTQADPAVWSSYGVASTDARNVLRQLREEYPEFHLWGEDATTGLQRGSPGAPSDRGQDELVWFGEQLLQPPIVAVGGLTVRHRQVSGRLLRWVPDATLDGGAWVEESRLAAARAYMAVVPLKATQAGAGKWAGDRLLIVGGQTYDGRPAPVDAEIYDPMTRTVTPVRGRLNRPRSNADAVQLPDGRVLIVGGVTPDPSDPQPIRTCEVFDPATGAFSTDTYHDLNRDRPGPRSVTFPDGKVLTVSGSSGEVFDPAASGLRWSLLCNSLSAVRDFPAVTVLDEGLVAVVGGGEASVGVAGTGDLFEHQPASSRFWPGLSAGSCPATTAPTWTAPALQDPRWYAWQVRLREGADAGKVLIGNGIATPRPDRTVDDPAVVYLSSVELYDPVGGTSARVGQTIGVGGQRRAVLLPGNRVLLTGGRLPGQPWGADNVTELITYNPPAVTPPIRLPSLPDGIDRMALRTLE